MRHRGRLHWACCPRTKHHSQIHVVASYLFEPSAFPPTNFRNPLETTCRILPKAVVSALAGGLHVRHKGCWRVALHLLGRPAIAEGSVRDRMYIT